MDSTTAKQLNDRIDNLERLLREFSSNPELDPQIKRTIISTLSTSSGKTSASATQAVNEAGTGTYDVMAAPDGFIKIGDFNVPYIN